jgi:hypothetical protein
MKKQEIRLTLHRETLLRLDDPTLKHLVLGRRESSVTLDTSNSLCGPTYSETCTG